MVAIGIDLGTTNSVISCYEKGMSRVIKVGQRDLVPSVVYIDEQNNIVIGEDAKHRILLNPERTLSSTKRFIGDKSWSKKINNTTYTPIDSAREVLSYLKWSAEQELGKTIRKAVVTVPAYFNDDQCKDTLQAAKEAGLEVLRLLPEPTAAAIRYGFEREEKTGRSTNQKLLVIDLGGGTFDVSLLEIDGKSYNVVCVDGNSRLGGDDFDLAILDYINDWIEERLGRSYRDDPRVQQALKEKAEEVKIELSHAKSADIEIDLPGESLVIQRFRRSQYAELIKDHLEQIVEKIDNVLQEGQTNLDEINRIVLVGGSCKHPVIQDLIRERYREPFIAPDMDTCVSLGAATVCASLLSPTQILDFNDVIAHSLGIDMVNEAGTDLEFVRILKRNTKYPTKGVVLGSARPGQDVVTMNVFRGEHLNSPMRNTRLGKLSFEITKEFVGETPNIIVAVFELDANRILTFTAVEIPLTDSVLRDPMTKPFLDKADSNNGVLQYDELKAYMARHKFNTWQEIINTN